MDHQLLPCPNKPNCVSSLSKASPHYIEPLTFPGNNNGEGMQRLARLLRSLVRVSIQYQDDHYIHAVCHSRVFRFKDDLEFRYDEHMAVCHVRSASRSGYYDFGVNRSRLEKIRQLLISQQKKV